MNCSDFNLSLLNLPITKMGQIAKNELQIIVLSQLNIQSKKGIQQPPLTDIKALLDNNITGV